MVGENKSIYFFAKTIILVFFINFSYFKSYFTIKILYLLVCFGALRPIREFFIVL